MAGLPSAGKSTAASALAGLLDAQVMLEPEEADWPPLVRTRATTGAFTALTWFRSVRVPQLFRADEVRRNGGIAVLDSYYDVLLDRYLGEPSFDWLLPRTDPYFDAAMSMARADWSTLPKADILVFIRIEEGLWGDFMKSRGRELDASARLARYFGMQDLMEAACQQASVAHGTRLLTIDQRTCEPSATARRIAEALCLK